MCEILTENLQMCAGIAFSKKVPQGEVKPSFYDSQEHLARWWQGLLLEMDEKPAAFLSTGKDIH
jgi:hypothetical protein